jgi:hypothetical protein
MPYTGEEVLDVIAHPIGRWLRIQETGAVFRVHEQPMRVRGPNEGVVLHGGPAELLSGDATVLTWRADTTEILPWWTRVLPRWALRALYRSPPKAAPPEPMVCPCDNCNEGKDPCLYEHTALDKTALDVIRRYRRDANRCPTEEELHDILARAAVLS